jgi:hypothetical protein
MEMFGLFRMPRAGDGRREDRGDVDVNRAKFGGRNRLHGPDPYNGSVANTILRAELVRRRCSAHNSDNNAAPPSRSTKKSRKATNHAFTP